MLLKEHIRYHWGMYLGVGATYSRGIGQDCYYLFYCVLQAFGFCGGDAKTITISLEDGEFCFSADGLIYLNEEFWAIQPMMSSFYVSQTKERSVVRFQPDPELWPEQHYDEKFLVNIMKDYAYMHPQTIIWKGQPIRYKYLGKDMFVNEFGVNGEIFTVHADNISIDIAKTDNGEIKVIDYVNYRRTDGGVHAYTLKNAIKTQFPELAKAGYIAAMHVLSPFEKNIQYEDNMRRRVGSMPEKYLKQIEKAVTDLKYA